VKTLAGAGPVTVTVLPSKIDLDHNEIVLRISDTGGGIPPDILPQLFEPFVTHGKPHGTGWV
jgi:signal transduction histidine kinase